MDGVDKKIYEKSWKNVYSLMYDVTIETISEKLCKSIYNDLRNPIASVIEVQYHNPIHDKLKQQFNV